MLELRGWGLRRPLRFAGGGRSELTSNQMRAAYTLAANTLVIAAALLIAAATATAGEVVPLEDAFEAGTVVVRTRERRLYLVLGDGTALRYRVAVGRPRRQWFGRVVIDGKYRAPAWTAPADMKRSAGVAVIPGGSPENPMGAAALTLSGERYAIHGTNRPTSIGTYASAGCVRMLNEDVLELFERVSIGTPVVVQH